MPFDQGGGHRVVVYGPGGIGKTTLACMAPGPLAFIDLEDSLPRLWTSLGECPTGRPDVRRVSGIETWRDIREALQAKGWDEIKTLVIDSATRAEELCAAHTLQTIPVNSEGKHGERLEDYGYGKGYQYLYDTFLPLLMDLDRHTREGRNVVLVCHDCTATVPNPAGQDWIRYEPRLSSPNSGKGSIRLRVREWADHVLFLGYDVNVRDHRATGRNTRTLWPMEQPHCMAKSRTLGQSMGLTRFDSTLWGNLLGAK